MAECPPKRKSCYLMDEKGFEDYFKSQFAQLKTRQPASAPNPVSQVSPSDSYYDLPKASRGLALILVNEIFEGELLERRGSEEDRKALNALFSTKSFDVVNFDNLSAKQMERIPDLLVQSSDHDFQGTSIFVCAILSHGGIKDDCEKNEVIYGSDGESVATSSIIESYVCRELEKKPKLVIIQACRGTKRDNGAQAKGKEGDQAGNEGTPCENDANLIGNPPNIDNPHTANQGGLIELNVKDKPEVIKTVTVPAVYQDYLIMHASPAGHTSCRDSNKGSWFVEHLCHRLADYDFFFDHRESDVEIKTLLQILTTVVNDVAQRQGTPENEEQPLTVKQVPVITFGLWKHILMKRNV